MTCIGDLRSRIAPLGPTPVLRQAVKWRTTARALMPQTLWPRDLRRATAAFVRYREQALRRRRERGFGAIPLASLRADVAAGSAVLELWPLGWAFGEDHPASLQMRPGARAAYRITCEPGTRFEARVYVEPPHGTAEPPPLRFTLVATAGDGRTARFAKELERPGEVAVLSLELPPARGELALELAVAAVDEAQPHGHGVWIDPCLAGPYPGTPPARSRFPSARPRRASGQGVAASPGPEPRFSILLPVRDPDPVFLDRAIASVLSQTRPEWELCVADDASSDPDVRALLAAHVEREPRVSVRRSEQPLGISGATNAALELARGEFVLLIDHDDEIEADSLAAFAAALGEFPDADLLYTDEAMIDGANRSLENFTKPAWSPRLFESNMYSCHLTALRRELVERLGGMRGEFDGSQDYDLVLRLSEATDRIVHVPGVRYYWRRHAGSASAGAKPYAFTAAKQALEEHFERSGRPGEVMPMNLPGCYRRSPARAAGAVAALLAVNDDDDARAVARCAAELVGAGADEVALACAGPAAAELAATTEATLHVGPDRASRAELLDLAAAAATGADWLFAVAEPVAGASAGWLDELLTVAAIDGVGAVGAVVVSATGRIEDAGAAISDGLMLISDLDAELAFEDPERVSSTQTCVRDVSACSGPLVFSAAAHADLGGLAEGGFDELAGADLCLRARERGLHVAVTPNARLERLGPARPCSIAERLRFQRRWWSPRTDPYYHPEYCRQRAIFASPLRPEPQLPG